MSWIRDVPYSGLLLALFAGGIALGATVEYIRLLWEDYWDLAIIEAVAIVINVQVVLVSLRVGRRRK